jgi:hypothetical protein
MIANFVKAFMDAQPTVEAELQAAHPEGYDAMVKRVVSLLAEVTDVDGWRGESPDPDRITIIDHGSYQGTKLYIIGASGYQPSTYWSIFVDYGSCSGCDSYEATRSYSDDPPTEEQARDYWTMMLHMVQSMREVRKADDAVDPQVGVSNG